MVVKLEYHTEEILNNDQALNKRLNQLGADGWTHIAFYPTVTENKPTESRTQRHRGSSIVNRYRVFFYRIAVIEEEDMENARKHGEAIMAGMKREIPGAH